MYSSTILEGENISPTIFFFKEKIASQKACNRNKKKIFEYFYADFERYPLSLFFLLIHQSED